MKTEIKKGDWLFSCSMQPLQFSHWRNGSNDSFVTIGGSEHSERNCSLSSISEKYALWFIENRCWEIYDRISEETMDNEESFDSRWELYGSEIKKLAETAGIKYEGY